MATLLFQHKTFFKYLPETHSPKIFIRLVPEKSPLFSFVMSGVLIVYYESSQNTLLKKKIMLIFEVEPPGNNLWFPYIFNFSSKGKIWVYVVLVWMSG